MVVVLCPGIHSPQLTQDFLASLAQSQTQDLFNNWLVFPATEYPPYSPLAVLTFLKKNVTLEEVLLICFSAGVVGAMGAAPLWQMQGGKVKAFIAIDGWGMALWGNFPIYRVSHDYFTHWSSALLGGGWGVGFYCEPGVEHLSLWRSPHQAWGWWVKSPGCKVKCSAAAFLKVILKQYKEM